MKRLITCIIASALTGFYAVTVFAQDADDGFVGRFLANYVTSFFHTGSNSFPGDEANAVLQTRDGYMWFGGYSGLIRYDGRRYTVWDAVSQSGFTSSNVRALFESAGGAASSGAASSGAVNSGTLWIGTNDKGLASYRNGNFTMYDKTKGVPSNTIRDITETADGRIFGGTPDGLFYIDDQGNITVVTLDIALHPFIVSLSSDTQNNVFVVLNTGELLAYTAGGVTVQYTFGARFRRAEYVSGGRIVAGGQDGVISITKFDGSSFSAPLLKQTPHVNVSAIYEDSRGFIWITSETGIGFLDADENYRHVGNPTGLGFYTGIWEDYQNGYWITASIGGVVKLSVSAFCDLNALYNFETGSANAILIDNGKTYIGTNSGLFILDEDGKPTLTDFTDSINVSSRVRGIFRDSGGDIWICTYSGFGVIRYSPSTGEYRYWTPADGLVSERTRVIAELPGGIIAVGTVAGVSFIRGDSVISAEEAFGASVPLELPTITVLSLCYTQDGTLYIGTDGNGVYSVSKDGSRRFREEDGLSGGVILRMLANQNANGVWVSTSSGLCYIEENGNVSFIEKLPPFTFLDIMQYNDDLILLTASAIIRTDAASLLDPSLPFEHVSAGASSGLTTSINANAWNLITGSGELYFCCDSGIRIYSFENAVSTVIPYAGITKIDIDGHAYTDFSQTIYLARNAYRLSFELSYLSFGLVDDAVMYYILTGQDSTPHLMPKTGSLDVSYTNLRGGNYSFHVWTEDSAGNIGSVIEVILQKELRLFERPIVIVISVLLGLLLIALAFFWTDRHRSRAHNARQREYRTIISQALIAIANAIDAKDSYTSGHSARVAAYSVEIARRMGMDKSFIENLYFIALLHDVGKIGIPNAIINKPDKLSDDEFKVMMQHTFIGQDILKGITTINNLTAGVSEHHEHWSGGGYNLGLNSENISLEGRIIAVADAYDAMSSNRSYRKALPKEVIIKEFARCKGSQFDPSITDLALAMIEQDYFNGIDINKIIDIE